ncbi:hypothetical protein SAMN05216316_3087 [Nitrosovibrio sp. Nv6]|nr:hypothetical protein SAMN05216316_3087 [Nitrosovibrio sp. Nv6]
MTAGINFRKLISREIGIEAPEGYPLFGWTEEGVRSYIENKPLAAGDVMIIYNGQAGFHTYTLAVVENPAWGKQRRVILSKSAAFGGSSFYRTGKNCFSPKGKSRMIPPTQQLSQISLDCDIRLKLAPYS